MGPIIGYIMIGMFFIPMIIGMIAFCANVIGGKDTLIGVLLTFSATAFLTIASCLIDGSIVL